MKKSLLLVFIAIYGISVFSQGSAIIDPIVVRQFEMGNSFEQLGLNKSAHDLSADTDYCAQSMATDGAAFYILDNVNNRILILSLDFHGADTIQGNMGGLRRLAVEKGVVVAWENMIGPNAFRNAAFFRLPSKELHSIPDGGTSLGDYALYNFVGEIEGTLVFDNDDFGYFAFKFSETNGLITADAFDKKATLEMLRSSKNPRYVFTDNLLLDSGQLISRSTDSVSKYFTRLGTQNSDYLFNTVFSALANGTYFFAGYREFWIVGKDGSMKRHIVLPENCQTSGFVPASDGYVYFMNPNYRNNSTVLYKDGPFPELMLGYGGTGGTINDDHVNIRENHDTKSVILTQVSKGTLVRILNKTANPETIGGQTAVWYQVRLWDRTEGWVFGAFLDVQK